MNKLRHKHASGDGKLYGVDIVGESGVCNTYEAFVWEPALVKINALNSATEVL
jgi:T-complex protein 1 subunit eta